MTFWAYYDIITIRVIFMEKLKKYFKNKDNLIAIGLIFYYFLIMEGASNLLSLLIKAFFHVTQ